MANTNIINAVFGSGLCAVTTSAFRANYGMVLRFSGIDLPTAFEVDFSNYDVMGRDSITAIGQNNEVQIPDDLWESGLNIYAYVYLHPTDDSGVTVYTVTIPVLGRPNRTEETPTPHEQSVIEQAISALNDAVEQTAADVASADASAQAAAQSEANASVSERSAAASASAALASQNAAESAQQGATESASGAAESAQNAAQSASAAAESATAAESSASAANTAKTAAQTAQTAAETAQAAAEQASDDADAAADRAEQAEQEVLSSMDGTYENLTSGNAQQLLSVVTESDSAPYLFRQTAANADRAYLDEVVGGTVAWNQLAENGNFADTTQWMSNNSAYGTFTVNNNVATFVAGASSVGNTSSYFRNNAVKQLKDHVLLGSISVYPPRSTTFRFSYPSAASGTRSQRCNANTWSNVANVIKANSDTNGAIFYYNVSADIQEGDTILFKNATVFDLTVMFGSTIADCIYSLEQANTGAGVAYFRKLFPNDYYEYNSGELLSVEGVSSHDTVGFNLLNEALIDGLQGITKTSSGWVGTAANWLNSTRTTLWQRVPHFEGVAYCLTVNVESVASTWVRAQVEYTDGSYVGGNQVMQNTSGTTIVITNPNKTIANLSLYYGSYGGNNVKVRSFCISFYDRTKNGTYEPYTKRTYPLDSSLTLRGIPKLDASGNLYYDGDTYAADGTVTRKYGIVEMGQFRWMEYSGYPGLFYIDVTDIPFKVPASNTVIANAVMVGYQSFISRDIGKTGYTKGYFALAANRIYVADDAYTGNTSGFKAAMQGVMLVYELADPTTETATPYRHLQICDPNGTEEFVSTGIVPVGHNTRYPENLRAKIEGLPWNFNSIIAMTETTTTASKAYSVGDYFILNNVLYRVTSAIASGGTITIGTNCRATTIMDEIKALS